MMELEIRNIRDAGEIDNERIVMRANKDVDIGGYLVIAARTRDDGDIIAGRVPHTFWLPDREVKAGDLIVIYSKSGKRSRKNNSSGSVSYFEYWGLASSIWSDRKIKPALMEIALWQSSSLDEGADR